MLLHLLADSPVPADGWPQNLSLGGALVFVCLVSLRYMAKRWEKSEDEKRALYEKQGAEWLPAMAKVAQLGETLAATAEQLLDDREAERRQREVESEIAVRRQQWERERDERDGRARSQQMPTEGT